MSHTPIDWSGCTRNTSSYFAQRPSAIILSHFPQESSQKDRLSRASHQAPTAIVGLIFSYFIACAGLCTVIRYVPRNATWYAISLRMVKASHLYRINHGFNHLAEFAWLFSQSQDASDRHTVSVRHINRKSRLEIHSRALRAKTSTVVLVVALYLRSATC